MLIGACRSFHFPKGACWSFRFPKASPFYLLMISVCIAPCAREARTWSPRLVCGRNRPSVWSGVNTTYLPLTLQTAQGCHGALLRLMPASNGAYTAEARRNMGRENMSFSVFPRDRTQKDSTHFLLFLFFRFPWKLQISIWLKNYLIVLRLR